MTVTVATGYFDGFRRGEAFYLQLEFFLLTVELLCLQSIEVVFRHKFPL